MLPNTHMNTSHVCEFTAAKYNALFSHIHAGPQGHMYSEIHLCPSCNITDTFGRTYHFDSSSWATSRSWLRVPTAVALAASCSFRSFSAPCSISACMAQENSDGSGFQVSGSRVRPDWGCCALLVRSGRGNMGGCTVLKGSFKSQAVPA